MRKLESKLILFLGIIFFSFFIFIPSSRAAVFLQENFDSWPDTHSNQYPQEPWCQDCGSTGDDVASTQGGITHYEFEVASPGRGGSGKSLKQWRYSDLWHMNTGGISLRQDQIPSGTRVLYLRYYMKRSADMVCDGVDGCNQKMWRYNIFGGNEMYINNYFGSIRYCPNASGNDCFAENVVSTAAWQDGQWHCHEFMFDIANRTVRYWLDGTQTYSKSNIDMGGIPTSATYGDNSNLIQHWPLGNRTGPPNDLMSYYQSAWRDVDVDDFVLADEYIGPAEEATEPEVFFQENFEDANVSQRGWYDGALITTTASQHIPGSTRSAEYRFTPGATSPINTQTIRHKFTASNSVYLSFWIKHSANWTGSNQDYHPHEFYFMTDKNGDWDGLAFTHTTAYVEDNEGRPRLALQDGENIDQARVGQDLTDVTENRSVNGCNGGNGSCYNSGSGTYWNGRTWDAGQIYFSDSAGPYYKGDWHHVEAYFQMNTVSGGKGQPDGIIRYWYDGNLIIEQANLIIRTSQNADMKFNQFVIAPWIGDGSPVDQTFWVDDLAVASARAGETDTIAPGSPDGLLVR